MVTYSSAPCTYLTVLCGAVAPPARLGSRPTVVQSDGSEPSILAVHNPTRISPLDRKMRFGQVYCPFQLAGEVCYLGASLL